MIKESKNTNTVSGPLIIPRRHWRVEEILRNGELRFFWVAKAKVVDRQDVLQTSAGQVTRLSLDTT